MIKVATYRHMHRAEPKEPTQFGSVSGSEIQNLPFSHSGIVSLYRGEPKEPTKLDFKIFGYDPLNTTPSMISEESGNILLSRLLYFVQNNV